MLKINPIFSGLTRPAMVVGVTLDYLSVIFMFSMSCFILTDSFKAWLVYIPLHLAGWIACRLDPNLFRIILKKLECTPVPNRRLWGCQSYDVF